MKNHSQSIIWNCACQSTAAISKTGYSGSFTDDES